MIKRATLYTVTIILFSCCNSYNNIQSLNCLECIKIKKKEVKNRLPFIDSAGNSFEGDITVAFFDTTEKVIYVSLWNEVIGYDLKFNESWEMQSVSYSLLPVY